MGVKRLTRLMLYVGLLFVFHRALYAQWVKTNGPISGSIRAAAVCDSTILIAPVCGRVFRSTDLGKKWTVVDSGIHGATITRFTVHKHSIIAAGSGLFLSTDHGISWSKIDSALPASSIESVAMNDSTIFVGDKYLQNLYRSTDWEASWSSKRLLIGGQCYTSFAVIGSACLVGTGCFGTFRSTDNGVNWPEITFNSRQVAPYTVMANGGSFFRVFQAEVSRSTDYGSSWTVVYSSGATGPFATTAVVSGDNIVFGGDILTCKTPEGMVETGITDGYFKGLAADSDIVVAWGDDNVHISSDNGISWTKADFDFLRDTTYSLAVSENAVYAATGSDGAFVSEDDGTSWSKVDFGSWGKGIQLLTIHGRMIVGLAGQRSSGLVHSTDNGATWTVADSEPLDKYIPAAAFYDSSLFAFGVSEFYRSDDKGLSWESVASVSSVLALTANDSAIFTGT